VGLSCVKKCNHCDCYDLCVIFAWIGAGNERSAMRHDNYLTRQCAIPIKVEWQTLAGDAKIRGSATDDFVVVLR